MRVPIPRKVARDGMRQRRVLRIGRPAGIIAPDGRVENEDNVYTLKRATIDKIALCLIKGYVFIPREKFSEKWKRCAVSSI